MKHRMLIYTIAVLLCSYFTSLAGIFIMIALFALSELVDINDNIKP